MDIGLEGAPITQGIAIVTLISSLLTDPAVVSLNARALVNGQLWRILTYAFPFGNSSQLIIGTILLYNLRIFERFMGSRKYGAFLVLSASVSTLSTIGIMSLFNSVDIEIYPASGPFFLIYSLLPLFYRFIPRLHSSKYIILGLTFSEKSWIYLLAGQLALSNGISTLVPALSGLLAGLLYGMDGLGLQQFRLPAFVNVSFHLTCYHISLMLILLCSKGLQLSALSLGVCFLLVLHLLSSNSVASRLLLRTEEHVCSAIMKTSFLPLHQQLPRRKLSPLLWSTNHCIV